MASVEAKACIAVGTSVSQETIFIIKPDNFFYRPDHMIPGRAYTDPMRYVEVRFEDSETRADRIACIQNQWNSQNDATCRFTGGEQSEDLIILGFTEIGNDVLRLYFPEVL